MMVGSYSFYKYIGLYKISTNKLPRIGGII